MPSSLQSSLDEYRKKRDFRRTSEPSGRKHRAAAKARFCVQKHAASRLHYDFRLEIDGVLKSWALPKGPSLVAGEKRYAAQTEDHPIEYGKFEGVIPEGEYGGGTVMLWDEGTFEPLGDPIADLSEGKLSFTLHGQKLRGKFRLIRMGGKEGDGKSWLLIKSRDEDAKAPADVDADPTLATPRSVSSGRDMATIATQDGGSDRQIRRARDTDPLVAVRDGDAVLIEGVRLTSPEKILVADQGLTKLDLAAYYVHVRDYILPHLRHRPVTFVRCPLGKDKKCFYQKHPNDAVPSAIKSVPIQEKDGPADYMVIEDLAGLISAVQVGALELHIWGSRADRMDRIDKPDRMVFDFDPAPDVGFDRVQQAVVELASALQDEGLKSFVMTTGGKGLHLVVPLQRHATFEEVKAYSRGWARKMMAEYPDRFIDQASKTKRRGKIFIDYLRNGEGATAICPYSTRARHGAPVATPIAWNELGKDLDPTAFDVHTILQRLDTLGSDPWDGYFDVKQRITKARFQTVEEFL